MSENPWHDRALRALYSKMVSRKAVEGWDEVYVSHHVSGESADCALYFGERAGIGHRKTQTGRPDLICQKGSEVATVGEVEQNCPPKKMLGDILAAYASSWAIVGKGGRSLELEVPSRPLLVFVLRKDTLTRPRSAQLPQMLGMLRDLSQDLIGPVELWLAAGGTGQLDPEPEFTPDRAE